MYMRGYFDVFEKITNRMASARGDDVVLLYASACALYYDMRECAIDIPENERPATYLHTMEKFERWIDTMSGWAMPRPGDTRDSRGELANTARQYLESARMNWPGDDWA
jgi:hypothetical protein